MIARIGPPHWLDRTFQRHRWRQRVSLVAGLESPFHHDDWVADDGVFIDASIAPIVAALNEAGYATQFCCSGLPEDHDGNAGGPRRGYLQFDTSFPAELTPPGVVVGAGQTHLGVDRSPKRARVQWAWLASKLGVALV